MNLRTFALIFGIVFVVIGILGFVPAAIHNGLLLGLFEVNALHNLVHIFSGVIGLLAATQFNYARLYFQVIGVVYLIVAILGFVMAGDLIYMHMNMADNILHLVIAVVALYLGFSNRFGWRRFLPSI